MYKNHHTRKTVLTFTHKNAEMVSSHICFTGDAIALLSNYPAKRSAINLDEWDWYEESRGGITFYIITNLKQPV